MPDLSIEDILKLANPRTEVARVCIDGRLLGRHKDLTARLTAAPDGSAEAAELRQQVAETEAAIAERRVPFTFAGIPYARRLDIERRFPRDDDRPGWDVVKGAHALIAACAVDPPMTEDQAGKLLEALSEGAADELFSAALLATQEGTAVAPLGPASASTPASG
jgi:hypothetical protein